MRPNLESNMFQAALIQEVEDARQSISTKEESAEYQMFRPDGSATFPVTNPLDESVRPRDFRDGSDGYSSERSFHTFILDGQEITKVHKATPALLFQILRDALGDLERTTLPFYGLIVQDGEAYYNVLHPVIAQQIAKKVLTLPEEFTILLFPIREHGPVSADTVGRLVEDILKTLAAVTTTRTTPVVKMKPARSLAEEVEGLTSENFMSRNLQMEVDGANPDAVVTPVQFHVRQMLLPWYGLISSRMTSEGYASTNIFPYLSGNIDTGPSANFGQTCVGSLSSRNYDSLYVLNRLNSESVYTEYSVPDDLIFAFPLACMLLSAGLILQIDPQKTEEAKDEKQKGKKSKKSKGETDG